MLIYSETINIFLRKMRAHTREILSQEMGLRVLKSRFQLNGYTYPIQIVLFEDKEKIGYFEQETFQIGLNKSLMFQPDEKIVLDILRHELAHLLIFCKYGNAAQAHGTEYRDFCRSIGWGPEVYSAKIDLTLVNYKNTEHLKVQKVLDKVKKLFSLASSTNSHEAELATLKANQLLIKYNLEGLSSREYVDDEEFFVKRVIEAKRSNTKIQAIYEILSEFFVQPVFNKGKGVVYLEVMGSKVNVELADYVVKFLFNEFSSLYKKAQKENPELKGATSKNSFYRGLAKGFVFKLRTERIKSTDEKSLVLLGKSLEKGVRTVYQRLSSTSCSTHKNDKNASVLGVKAGRNLSLRPGVSIKTKNLFLE